MTKTDNRRLQAIVDDIAATARRATDRGRVADYIPELSTIDGGKFGIAVAPIEGQMVVAGDADEPFSIQSISKVFSLTIALECVGAALWQRVGREPSGDPFNSIVLLEHDDGVPRNPFINPGAIVVADVILEGREPSEAINKILGLCQRLSDDPSVAIDARVAASEARTGERNRALAHFIAAEGNLRAPVEKVLEVYFNQCAIAMCCRQLAMAGRHLCAAGQPLGRTEPILTLDRARRINALMMTCGLYDAAGDFAYRIGIPGKSGIGGGILCVVPGVASIAVWSPGLNRQGSSKLGIEALETLVRATGWSIFGPLA